jgi:hypothetical protein
MTSAVFRSRPQGVLRVLASLSCAASLLALAPAHAADKSIGSSYPKGTGRGPLMSRAELRQCMAQHERIVAERDEMTKLQEQINKEKDELARSGAELKEQMVWLDRYSPEAVAEFNTQSSARDKLIDAYEARVPAYNRRVEALVAERAAFAKSCENRRFDEKDEMAIKSGK